jgi:hypothetical protein
MARDLAELQDEVIARGYTHDFGSNHKLLPEIITSDLHIVDSISFDSGTDPGDDVTMYLIESRSKKGYLIVSDSFNTDPEKAAFVVALLTQSDG